MRMLIFYDFHAFFIIFNHANACSSMCTLVKIHNTGLNQSRVYFYSSFQNRRSIKIMKTNLVRMEVTWTMHHGFEAWPSLSNVLTLTWWGLKVHQKKLLNYCWRKIGEIIGQCLIIINFLTSLDQV